MSMQTTSFLERATLNLAIVLAGVPVLALVVQNLIH